MSEGAEERTTETIVECIVIQVWRRKRYHDGTGGEATKILVSTPLGTRVTFENLLQHRLRLESGNKVICECSETEVTKNKRTHVERHYTFRGPATNTPAN